VARCTRCKLQQVACQPACELRTQITVLELQFVSICCIDSYMTLCAEIELISTLDLSLFWHVVSWEGS